MNPNEEKEKIETTLEDNIIDIQVPDSIPESIKENQIVTPIPEVMVEEHKIEEPKENLMVESNQSDDDKVTGKGIMPIVIVFSIFIVIIVGLPYIDDIIAMINSEVKEEEIIPVPTPTPTLSPTITPTPSIVPTTVPSEIIDNLTQ